MKTMQKLLLALTFILAITGCNAPVIESKPSPELEQIEDTSPEISAEIEETATYEVETIRLQGGTDWGAPSPFLNSSRGPGTAKMKLVFGSLLEKDETGDIPWLAESWKADGPIYTFTLFDGLTFHDGEKLTAKDVGFTLDYYREHPPVTNYLGAGDGYLVDSYEILDELTIAISVKNPNADTLNALGNFVVLPQHIWESVEDPNAYNEPDAFIGSSAYTFSQYDGAAGTYEFLANPDWKNGTPAAEKIQFVPVSDPILAFENGEIDYTTVPADLKATYDAQETIGMLEKSDDMGYKMLINYEKMPEFLDLELRQAVYAAIDRQAIVDNVFRGAGHVGSAGYVPTSSAFASETVTQYDFDQDLAKERLAPLNLTVNIIVGDTATYVSMAEIVKQGLEAAGVTVSVSSYDTVTHDDKIKSGDYEIAIVGNGGWGANPPAYLMTLFSDNLKYTGSSPHYMGARGYENPELTALVESQQWETDFETRKAIFQEAQDLISQEIPIFVLANQSDFVMFRTDYFDGWMKTYAYLQADQNRLSYMSR